MPFAPRPAASASLDVLGLGQNSVDQLCLVRDYPAAGAKVVIEGYRVLPGGQVATAVLAARRLGLRAGYLGAVGDDPWGTRSCELLGNEGVLLALKVVTGAATQSAVVIVDQRGERTILEHADPRTVVHADELDRKLVRSSRVLHLDITENTAAIQAARWAREAGTLVSLDIDRLRPGTDELLHLVDILVAAEELSAQLGCHDPRQGLEVLRQRCAGLICITCGERGCVALEGDEPIWVPAFDVPVVDTTGCGDVFRGALLYGVLERWPLRDSLRFAAAAAALQAGSLGAQPGVPSLERVQRFLAGMPPLRAGNGLSNGLSRDGATS